jgi:hypothetical protein
MVVVVMTKMMIMKKVLVGAFTLKLMGYGNGLGGGAPQSRKEMTGRIDQNRKT